MAHDRSTCRGYIRLADGPMPCPLCHPERKQVKDWSKVKWCWTSKRPDSKRKVGNNT